MTTTLNVDVRETHLIEELNTLIETKTDRTADKAVNLQVSQMDIGDIMIEYVKPAEEGLPPKTFCLYFERKTGADLAASVKDGRYREQKKRLLDASSFPHHVTYIIEKRTTCTLSKSVFDGVVINTMFRDGAHVMFTDNVKETASWIYTIAEKIASDPSKFLNENNDAYVSCLKVKSRRIDNIDVNTCYLLQLGQIPGVSTKIAAEIVAIYPTMYALLKEINEHPDPVKQISKIPLIGEKKAKMICSYMRGSNE